MSVVKHFRNYASAGLIGSLLGLITFPILARSLSVGDYGLLGLVMSTVTIFVALGKLGLQHSVVRFFAAEQERGETELRTMLSTVSAALLIMSVICAIAWMLYSRIVVPNLSSSAGAMAVFFAATLIIPIKILSSGAQNLLKANENSGINAIASVSEKLLRLALIVICLLVIGLDATSVVSISIFSELVLLGITLHGCWPFLKGLRPSLQIASLTPLIAFGVPSMAGEISGVLLEIGDRYVIEAYLGAKPLGLYAAAYNMSMYLEWVLIAGLHSALIPHYIRIYEREGKEATRQFVGMALRHYVSAGVGIAVAFAAIAPEFIWILAGEKYNDAHVIVPWVVAALFVGGGMHLFAAGCFVYKKPIMLVKWTLIAFVLNIILNILTVPKYGLVAAAAVTFVCYLVRAVGLYRDTSPLLKVDVDFKGLLLALLAGLAAYTVAGLAPELHEVMSLIIKGTLATATYVICLAALSKEFRGFLFDSAQMIKNRITGG